MYALVKTKKGPGNMEVREVSIPEIGNRDVLLKIWATGVCGSDVHILHDEHPYTPPVIIGHEFSGTIEQVGDEVKNFRIGDRVVADLETLEGRLGVEVDGSYAQFMRVPAHLVHKLPENVSLDEGVLLEPLVAVSHALLYRSRIYPADFVVVIGPGPIGLMALQVAQLFSPLAVMVTGLKRDEFRLSKARELGADFTFFSEDDPVKEVLRLTEGKGADLVVDCSGGEESITQATRMTKIGGWITILGLWGKDVKVNIDNLPYNCLSIRGSWGWEGMESGVQVVKTWAGAQSWERALQILALGKVKLEPLITHTFPLNEWEKAFRVVEEKSGLKVLVKPIG